MKKNIFAIVLASVMFTSCGYVGSGALWGGSIGSAVGGLAGGYRGHEVGRLLGMAGGAAVGAAVQGAQERKRAEDVQQYREEKARLEANRAARRGNTSNSAVSVAPASTLTSDYDYAKAGAADSGFTGENNADDRIDIDFSDNNTGDYGKFDESSVEPVVDTTPNLEIRNVRFFDADNDGAISRREECSISFEVMNHGGATVYGLQPTVLEVSGNKHIFISPSVLIESIEPGKGVRYTARIITDANLKAGKAMFCVAVNKGNQTLTKISEFTIPTKK